MSLGMGREDVASAAAAASATAVNTSHSLPASITFRVAIDVQMHERFATKSYERAVFTNFGRQWIMIK
eukprot:scaffold21580_cov97-Skeletonema_dohrnii-CCMP3373.AAC.1